MRRIKLFLRVLAVVLVGGFLHYVLPQHDVVRVTSTEVIRADFSWYNRLFYAQTDSGTVELANRDLRLINTEKQRAWFLGFFRRDATRVMVYRNEDTGWIWPPYFKFDSSDLQAEAAASVDTTDDQWAVVTHYGWRIRLLTVYPNAIGIREVDGPDVTIIPWFNIIFFAFCGAAWLFLRAAWRQFRERSVDPVMDRVEAKLAKADQHVDTVGEHAKGVWGRFKAWLDTWKGKPRV